MDDYMRTVGEETRDSIILSKLRSIDNNIGELVKLMKEQNEKLDKLLNK